MSNNIDATVDATVNTVTEDAIAAIGRDPMDDDWKLEPQTHAASFEDAKKAGPLVRILGREKIAEIVDRFCACDAVAVKAQDRYKRWGRLGIFATMAATGIGALFLLPLHDWLPIKSAQGSFFVLQYLFLALAFIASWKLARSRSFADWQEHRGAAEIARVALFDEVMSADESVGADELALLPLKLEYFRRYQHDVQRRYYRGRGEQHARGAFRSKAWRWFSWIVYAIAALVAIPAAIIVINGWIAMPKVIDFLQVVPWFTAISHIAEKSLLAVGIMTSAVHAANEARTRMDMDERNAARYELTSQNLEFLADDALKAARKDAAGGNTAGVIEFVSHVQRQISSEHQQWVLLSEAMGKLVV